MRSWDFQLEVYENRGIERSEYKMGHGAWLKQRSGIFTAKLDKCTFMNNPFNENPPLFHIFHIISPFVQLF